MQNAKFFLQLLQEPWPVPALKAIQEMVWSVVIKSVSLKKNSEYIVEFRNYFKFFIIIAAPIEIGCSSDDECLSNQACRNRACINPCSFDDPCSSTAQCSVSNHKAECRCPPGLTGDPYSLCVPSKIEIKLILMGHFFKQTIFVVKRGECQHDTECPDNKACINNQCLDPCTLHDPCGKNAECETRGHRPVCRCPSGWAGDPHTECYTCRFSLLEKRIGFANW